MEVLYTSGEKIQKRGGVERRPNNAQHYSKQAPALHFNTLGKDNHTFSLRLLKNGNWTQFIVSYRAGRARGSFKLMEEVTVVCWESRSKHRMDADSGPHGQWGPVLAPYGPRLLLILSDKLVSQIQLAHVDLWMIYFTVSFGFIH